MKKVLFILLLLPMFVSAQKRHHEMGIFGGAVSYYGDLQENWFPDGGYRAGGGLSYKYFVHPNIGLRTSFNYASLWGADSTSNSPAIQRRNLDFQTNLLELAVGIEANLLPVETDQYKVSPYVFAQMGLFYYNPYTLNDLDEKIFLRPLSTEGQGLRQYPNRKPYSLVNVAFPLGAGVKFFVGKTVMISAEMGFRYTATDYLDDVSQSYVNLDTLFAYKGQQSVELSFRTDEFADWDGNYPNEEFVRGDNKPNDWYWFGGIGVSIYFNSFGNNFRYKQSRCPRGVRNSR